MTFKKSYILAFDTANEMIAIGLGSIDLDAKRFELLVSSDMPAHRSSNTKLLPSIDALLAEYGIAKEEIACVVCGRGPGSFTGVRICMASAKGLASSLKVPLYGVSTLDSVAWSIQNSGYRGYGAVVADAMRREVYPVTYNLSDEGIGRLEADSVEKANEAAQRLAGLSWIAGDALVKYRDLFAQARNAEGSSGKRQDKALDADESVPADSGAEPGYFLDEKLWAPRGEGLLLAAQELWRKGELDPLSLEKGNPGLLLPIYTRLSDAEENERIRLSKNDLKNLNTGVQEEGIRKDQRASARDSAIENAQADAFGIVYRPLDAAHVDDVASKELQLMGTDAWSSVSIADELSRKDRIWWAAYASKDKIRTEVQDDEKPSRGEGADQAVAPSAEKMAAEAAGELVLIGYAGAWIVDAKLQILKVATDPAYRRRGVAQKLLELVSVDGRDLGAQRATLEVRAKNDGAQAFYASLGFESIGVRPGYYSDKEDACIMEGPLILPQNNVGGMRLEHIGEAFCGEEHNIVQAKSPLILAIESSCDETAAAVVDGEGKLLSDVVASQIDFHARFGGVVPEIASRKHIEAICGVTQEALDLAATRLGRSQLEWRYLDAVAVSYAPGLVGALVVGLAFAKGAAWGAGLPLVGVNHLEGHIYASKIATPDITPPMVVSLVSGGHTMLVHVEDWGVYKVLGTTLDDAVGEAFDKVAKAMGLGYPGGPIISKLAEEGDPRAVDFPRAMMHSGDLQFSLSGLKTAVISYLKKEEAAGRGYSKVDVAASFQQAVIDVQVAKAKTALLQTGAKEFCLGGGVAANKALRAAYEDMCASLQVRLSLPPFSACTDNAGMIALAALDRFKRGRFFDLDADAYSHVSLDEPY